MPVTNGRGRKEPFGSDYVTVFLMQNKRSAYSCFGSLNDENPEA